MPRIARIVAVNHPHHITQRGNYHQEIFLDNKDREEYLSWLNEYSIKYKLSILAYCLMSNHVHFIGIPEREDSLARTFNSAHMRYSQYYNKKIGARGHLWQGRFFSCVLDEGYLKAATRYIERNPVRAMLVNKPWDWQWSSAINHVGNVAVPAVLQMGNIFNFIDMMPMEWETFIDIRDDREFVEGIEKHTLSGRPFGGPGFVEKLEKKFGKMLNAQPKGRPRKNN